MLEIVRNAFLTGNDRARDWMKIAAPLPAELTQVATTIGIDENFLRRRLQGGPVRPVVEDSGFLTFQMLVPTHQLRAGQMDFHLVPLNIFLVPHYFVTLSAEALDFLDGIIRPEAPIRRWELILRIAKEIALRYVHMARDVARETESIEAELKVAQRHHVIYRALEINDRLLQLDMGLLQLEYVIDEMRERMPKDSPSFMEEFTDARIEIRQAREQVDLEQQTLNEIMDAYTYVIHNNVNHIFKFMAALIILASIPIIVCDSASMNVPLGAFRTSSWGFPLDVGFLVLVEAITAWVFYRKGWLTLG